MDTWLSGDSGSHLLSWHPDQSGWALGPIGWTLFLHEGDSTGVPAHSADQPAPTVTIDPEREGQRVCATWASVRSERGTEHRVTVVMTLLASGTSLRCELAIDNDGHSEVASAHFPAFARLAVPTGRTLRALTRDYYGGTEHQLWPRFAWNKAYYGTLRPTLMTGSLMFGNPTAPFVVLSDEQESVAATVVGPTPAISSWQWELDPAYTDTIGDYVASDTGAGVRFQAVHLLDLAAGAHASLPTVELHHARGGWQPALRPYREQRRTHHRSRPPVAMPAWAQGPICWFQVGLNTPVGDRRYRFGDLPEFAKQCAGNEVDVLHVIGWNAGGQDRNNPSHDPDPNLGGPEELRAAITACHEQGVKVVLFAKFTWAEQATERFRRELVASAIRDPYGDYYRNPGYQYLTPHQFLDVDTRRLVPMCYLHEDYLRTCEDEFEKILATGADGMLFDEAMHHTPALQCYASNHGHVPGASAYAGDVDLAHRLRARVPRDRDFLFAAETLYEDLQSSYQLSYIRSHYVDHQPLTRFVNPELRMLTTVTGLDDRNQIHQGLLYGYEYCYEPRHFKGVLADMPATVAYGRRATALRYELAEHLWHGTYEGDVPLSTTPLTAHATAHWQAANGTDLFLLANYDPSESARFCVDAPISAARGIDEPWRKSDADISVPPRSLVVVR